MGARSYFFLDNQILSTDEVYGQQDIGRNDDQQLLADKSVLVIDDSPINLSVAEKTLSKFGAASLKAFSAKEGLQSFHQHTRP